MVAKFKKTKKLKKIRTTSYILLGFVLLIAIIIVVTIKITDHYTAINSGKCRVYNSNKLCMGELVGMTESKAYNAVAKKGFAPTVVTRDGKNAITGIRLSWCRSEDVDLTVVNNIVVKAKFTCANMGEWQQ